MKKIIVVLLMFSAYGFSQRRFHQGVYEFQTMDSRTEDGWKISKVPGEIKFLGDSIQITTIYREYVLYVESKQQFVRNDQYIYVCRDIDDNKTNIRTYIDPKTPNQMIVYFYSSRQDEKYFKVETVRCEINSN